ncbi:unnamed protein product [Lactuca saligna]|uniref:Uncharacterized protein n=1 Tax=Lactuca saligna TaxID=75948 RepID=A0AA35V572_LACSI|nr:unnamed protein product [Lactuca saligna]
MKIFGWKFYDVTQTSYKAISHVSQNIITSVKEEECCRHDQEHFYEKKKKHKKKRNLVLQEDSTDEEVVPETPITDTMGHSSPVRDSPVQSIFEETKNLDGNVETSIVDTTINHGEKN